MFEELKKRSLKSSLFGSIICLIIGLVLIGWNAANVFYAIAGYAEFEQLKPDKIRSQLVDINMTANFGCFLEEYEVSKNTGRRTTTDLYYIIWTGDEYEMEPSYMAIKVPARYEKQLEEIAENTYNGYYSDPILFSGKIEKLDSEEYGYFKEYFQEAGFTDEEIAELTLPYYIDTFASKASMNSIYILIFGGGVILFIIGVCMLVKGATGGYLKKLRKDISESGYTESSVESDYRGAYSFDKKGSVKMGRLMTYYTLGAVTRALPNNKIMWAYQNTVTHRTNGIKTGTSYNVELFVEGNKNSISLSVPNETTAQEMLQRINTMFPWVVVGYSDELKKMFNKERAQFLQIRYNTCEHTAVEPGFENFNSQPNA